jgi:biotin operon repressor
MFDEGTNLQVIAAELGRSEVAIKRRLRRLRKI